MAVSSQKPDFYTSVSRRSNHILFSGYEDGEKVYKKYHFSPSLYVASDEKAQSESAQYKTLFDEPLKKMTFSSMREASDFYKQREGTNLNVYGNMNFVYQYICDRFPNGIDPKRVTKADINVCFFDFEMLDPDADSNPFPDPEEAKFPIVSGAFYFTKTNTRVVLGLKPLKDNDQERDFIYIRCDSETELLQRICTLFETQMPDIVTGWNIRTFDIPYLIHRLQHHFGERGPNKLSPWSSIAKKSVMIKGNQNVVYDIIGVAQLDYLDLFKKFSAGTFDTPENYRLDTIANMVLGQRKLDYSEYSNLNGLYKHDFDKFIDYNWKDTFLVNRIDEQINYIDIAMMMAYKSGINFQDTLATVPFWDTYIYQSLLSHGIIIPPNKPKQRASFAGGYVKQPIVGKHDWIMTYDLASLYPNIIIQYNLGNETIINDDQQIGVSVEQILDHGVVNEKADQYVMTANGHYFKKDQQGAIPFLVEGMYSERKVLKKEMITLQKQIENGKIAEEDIAETRKQISILNNAQMAIKLGMNSLYGCYGTPYFRYFDARIAEAVTLTGQLTIKWAEKAVNEYLKKLTKKQDKDFVCAIDTDSIMVDFSDVVNMFAKDKDRTETIDYLDSVGREIFEPFFKKSYDTLFKTLGGYKNRMVLEREKIAVAVFTGKKRNFMRVFDNEGVRYKEPVLKITGIEAIKSSTPKVVREALKKSFAIILDTFDEKSFNDFVKTTKAEFDDGKKTTPEMIAFPRTVNNIEKFMGPNSNTPYIKGTPIQVQAAISYNRLIEEKQLQNKYRKIISGEKLLFVYLKKPNPLGEHVIGFIDVLPPEFGLHPYIDRDTQFDKTFTSVADGILEKINWKTSSETDDDLSAFF